ncbi:hypothetical protein BGZ73_001299 [Actinomortierella ambigua]|nr:hypothetical protein BGZ73_001299 [Actinomortierella ambigua]
MYSLAVSRTAIEPKISNLVKFIKDSIANAVITPLPRRYFNEAQGLEYIQQYIVPESSATLLVGIQTKYFCLAATAALVKHIETSRNALFLNHSIRFKYQGCHGSMLIDHATARSLELTVNLSSNREKHSLLGILNHTCTSMGSRLLRTNILQPLNDEATIQTRLDCVQELLEKEDVFLAVRQALKPFLDLDHLITAFVQVPSKPSIKHSEQTINNIIQLKYSLTLISQLASNMAGCKNKLFVTIHRLLTDPSLSYCLDQINRVIEANVVFEKTAIGLRNQRCFAVQAGFNGLLDVARQTYKEIVNDTFELVNSYVETYNLTLRIQFNSTMGYYLTMPADHLGQGRSRRGRDVDDMRGGTGDLPSIFINVVQKQKMLRFTTLEMIKKNSKIEDALVEVYLMSDRIVQDLSSEIRTKINAIYKASEAIAMLDMLVAFAHQCTLHDYVRPEFGSTLVLQQARHPIREIMYAEPFVPNDTYASFAHSFQIITGPNMSGKSTYLRQIALIHIMAQIGSYVPAEFACLKILDQLFTRICNDDNIEVNASTFTVEMRETAYILQSVTDKSLVIVDELGRGTSTHDGMSIAFAVCEVLAQTRAFVFFATHFQELASTLTVYHNVVNLHLETEVRMEGNTQPTVVYKYRVTDGRAQEEHYGLTLAKMMRLPLNVVERADRVSHKLKNMVESWRHASKSSEVIQCRRKLAEQAMYLTDYVKSTLSRVVLGKDIPSFPYNIGERVESFNSTIWSLHKGTKREDDSPVSILCFDCVRQRDKLPIARNAFKKFRTIRHPDLIKYVDGVETESHIYIVTDAVTPLEDHLARNLDPNLIRWGLYKVANVLKFLTMDASFIHGNIRTSSIFVTKSGEWKVGGFELVSSLKEDQPAILSFSGLVPDSNRYAPPEVRKKSWNVVKDNDLWATDTWHFACLIYEVYNGAFSTPEQLATPGNVPAEMAPYYKNLLRPDPKVRPSVSDFLDKGLQAKGFFQNDLVQVVLFLENFSVKEPLAKETFLRKLDMQVERFPKEFCRYKVLPELVHALEYGSGGAKVLAPIVKIGQDLDEQEYDAMVGGVIVKMFASTDRAIRLSLLENLAGFIERINKKVVNDKIFPAMALGFTDTAPIIREWTVKSVLLVIGKLSDRVINYELLRYLGKLQTDEEPGIRTNAVICLGKVSKYLNDGTKAKILVPAFTRSLRDPFAHARVASLMALSATAESYAKEDIANRILPCISLTLIDTEKMVRVQAFKSMETFVRRVEKIVESMPDSALPPSDPAAAGAGRASPARPSTPSATAGGSAVETWAGWAVSSITKKLVTGEMQAAQPLPETPTPSAVSGGVPSRSGASTPSHGMTLGSGGGANGMQARPNGHSAAGNTAGRYSAALAAIEQDDPSAFDDAGGWGQDGGDLFADMGNDLEPFESMEPSTPSPASSATMKPSSSSSLGVGSRPASHTAASSRPSSVGARSAGGSMSLGGANKAATSSRLAADMLDDVDAWGDEFTQSLGGSFSSSTSSSRPPLSNTTTASSSSLSSPHRPAGSFTTTHTSPSTTIPTSTSATSTINSASAMARKEERAAELAKKREERRLRMAEAKEKKAAGSSLGAKKI